MSYPNTETVQRFVPAGSQAEDVILIGTQPYVVLLGDKQGDCPPNCPDQERINEGQADEAFKTTVYTVHSNQAFTVNLDADVAVALDQPLYIKDDTVGAVVLTNDQLLGLTPDIVGKVFDFGSPNNLTPPVTNWLQEGDTGNGYVEMVLPFI